jgi:xanthine/uracil permease
MIVLIIVINRFTKGFVKALSLFLTMVIGYLVSAAFGLITFDSISKAGWVEVPTPLPYGGLEWPGLIGVITVIVCFFATAVETTGHTLAVSRICGVPPEGWRIRGAVSNDGIGSAPVYPAYAPRSPAMRPS